MADRVVLYLPESILQKLTLIAEEAESDLDLVFAVAFSEFALLPYATRRGFCMEFLDRCHGGSLPMTVNKDVLALVGKDTGRGLSVRQSTLVSLWLITKMPRQEMVDLVLQYAVRG